MRPNTYLLGILIVILGGVCLSTSGILIRVMDQPDGWRIVYYRSLMFFFFVLSVVIVRNGRNTIAAYRAIGWEGLCAAVFLGIGSVSYIFAMLNTTVANVVFIIGSGPLVTALVAWIFLRERISPIGLIAMMTALLGIGLMFIDGLNSGGLLGNSLALFMVFMFAFYLLMLRRKKNVDMTPATGLAGLVSFAVAAMLVESLEQSTRDLVICFALGTVQFGLGFLLLTLGSRYIPAAEVALFALSESILNPLWVWIGVGEVPGTWTLYGSAIVLTSVVIYCLIAIRNERRIRNEIL